MSQSDILEFLKKNKDNWFEEKQISVALGAVKIYRPLLKLRQFGLLDFKIVRINNKYKHLYKHKEDEE